MVINTIKAEAIKKIRFNLSANIFLRSEIKNEIIRLIVNKIEEIKKADGRRNMPNLNKNVPNIFINSLLVKSKITFIH